MTSILGKFTKQSTETLDYDVDFTDWLSNRTDLPDSHTVVVDTGITKVTDTRNGNIVKVVLSGGTNGTQYKITVRLTTNTALVKEADFYVKIKDI